MLSINQQHNIFQSLSGVTSVETQSIKKEVGIDGNFQYGQKNISTLERNLMNSDEISRLPFNILLAIIKGNEPVLLEKMIYKDHELASELEEVSISEYKPNWNKKETKPIQQEKPEIKEEIKETEKRELTFDDDF